MDGLSSLIDLVFGKDGSEDLVYYIIKTIFMIGLLALGAWLSPE